MRALDWVGLDAYPGTVFPPVETGDGYRDGMVNAMSVLRDCYLPLAGIPETVPIKVEENGYPTLEPARSYAEQVNAMRQMVGAVHEFRGTFNVTDYRWFDLRDHRTSSTNFQHQYGLLRDDYTPKPAFAVYASSSTSSRAVGSRERARRRRGWKRQRERGSARAPRRSRASNGCASSASAISRRGTPATRRRSPPAPTRTWSGSTPR